MRLYSTSWKARLEADASENILDAYDGSLKSSQESQFQLFGR